MTKAPDDRYVGCDGRRLYYRSVTPERPLGSILLLHGMSEHSGRYEHVMAYFAERGYAVFVPDLRGFGRNTRTPGYLESLDEVVADVPALAAHIREITGSLPMFLLGHSMGGLIAATILEGGGSGWSGAIFSGALIQVPDNVSPVIRKVASLIARFFPTLPIQRFDYDQVCRDRDIVETTKTDPLYYRGMVRARTGYEILKGILSVGRNLDRIDVPLLILHGGEDRSVPAAASKHLYDRVSSTDRTLRILPGLYHEVLNEPERQEVLNEIYRWVLVRTVNSSRIGSRQEHPDSHGLDR